MPRHRVWWGAGPGKSCYPRAQRIGAIVRGEGRDSQVMMPHHDTVIQSNDHIIIFIPDKRSVRQVEKLFQVGATFFG